MHSDAPVTQFFASYFRSSFSNFGTKDVLNWMPVEYLCVFRRWSELRKEQSLQGAQNVTNFLHRLALLDGFAADLNTFYSHYSYYCWVGWTFMNSVRYWRGRRSRADSISCWWISLTLLTMYSLLVIPSCSNTGCRASFSFFNRSTWWISMASINLSAAEAAISGWTWAMVASASGFSPGITVSAPLLRTPQGRKKCHQKNNNPRHYSI